MNEKRPGLWPRSRDPWFWYPVIRNGFNAGALVFVIMTGYRPSVTVVVIWLGVMFLDQLAIMWLNDARLIWRGIARLHEDTIIRLTLGGGNL